jgi:predicted esterase
VRANPSLTVSLGQEVRMSLPRRSAAGLALLVLVASATAAGATQSRSATTARAASYVQPCGGTSWVAGTTNVCAGTVVYRDYVYDDAGADTGGVGYDAQGTQKAYGTISPPAGDQRYPAGDTSSADLVSLRLSRDGDRVRVVAEVNALRTARSTVVELAVDTDGRSSTGGGRWPGLTVRSRGWDRAYRFSVGDPRSNTLTGSFPLPAAARWRVQAVTARAADGTVMNVAFRGPDEHAAYKLSGNNPSSYAYPGQGAWFEDRQAAALAKGDVSAFGQYVATADLRPSVTRLADVGPGLHERVYTSRYSLGEGISYAGVKGRGTGGAAPGFFSQVYNLLGRYQPYGIYLPKTAAPHGLQMEWHGSNQGIVAQINQPGMQRQFGEDLDRILVVPAARGPNGYGSDISERDLLDVMADVEAHYPVDRSRVFSSGYSQGGYITFRMAMLHPDLFAGFTSWVGFTGDDTNGTPAQGTGGGVSAGAVGNMVGYAGNLRYVPGSMLFSGADELVQVPSARAMEQAFARAGDRYTWYMHPVADHFTYAVADDWRKEAADSRGVTLVRNPAHVTFTTDPRLDAPQYGIRHDRAYWVSALRGRSGGKLTVDLVSHGRGGSTPVLATTHGAGTTPVPWVSTEQAQTGSRALVRGQLLEGALTNVRSATVDLAAAGLCRGTRYRITSDGPATLRLGGRTVALHKGLNTGTV